MLIVMQGSSDQATHLLKIIHPKRIFQTTFVHKEVKGLEDICTVSLIVIGNNFIPSSDFSNKAHQVAEIDFGGANQTSLSQHVR